MSSTKSLFLKCLLLSAAPLLPASAVTLTFEGTCVYSGSTDAISADELVTVVVELDDTTVSPTDGNDVADYSTLSTYQVSVATPSGYSGSFDASQQGTVAFDRDAQTTMLSCFAQDETGGLPGISDGEYGAMFMLDAELGEPLPADIDGINIPTLLAGWAESPTASGTIYLEPGWDSRVEIQVSSATVELGGSSVLPSWFSDASEIANGWRYFEWFKGFKPLPESDWIYHGRHGWLFMQADDTNRMFLWDGALGRWMFTNAATYPWMYVYGPDEGWFFFFEGGSPGERFFQRGETKQVVSEQQLRVQ